MSVLDRTLASGTAETSIPVDRSVAIPSGRKYVALRKILMLAQVRTVFYVLASGVSASVIASHDWMVDRSHLLATIYVALLQWSIFYFCGLFEKEVLFSRRLYLRRIGLAWLIVTMTTLSIALTLDVSHHFSGEWARLWFAQLLIMLVIDRFAFMAAVRRWKAQGYVHQRAIIVGTGENGRKLVAHLHAQDDLATTVIGFVDDRQRDFVPSIAGVPVLGTTRDLVGLIRANQVDFVIVALPLAAVNRVSDIVKRLRAFPVDIFLAPDLAAFAFPCCRQDQVAGTPVLHVYERPISGWSYAIKRSEDIVVAISGLVLLSPIFVLAALLVKATSPGPIFFRQKRYGFNNSIINVFKFRTMYAGASDQLGVTQAVWRDPRVTRIGRFLRRTSLDELPQLINVLKGEMSVVGPRPHALGTRAAGHLFEDLVDEYAARHRVRPGMTGWAQIHGLRGETKNIEKLQRRVEFDLYYIENWSLWLDIVIIVRTLPTLFSPNAF